ncbi:hypothetical protein BP6252_13322 [Coleophoma cylindrospora]|uniref:Uncharacterized protein n=1 Tax=Coleophoma cylindrospora TaxID=1849047 RepID=A0A3D8QAJ5_9HELO|nr:hypothetical protein BP6252_13322 [Coleophoma cylindrospora]
MQYTDLMKPDEDWRELGDPSERRKIQNRIAQRAYRRNMRERATKIEELKKQITMYEELRSHNTQAEDSTYQQSNSSSTLPPHEREAGGWCPPQQAPPPVAPSEEQYNVSFSSDPQFSRVQQVCPAPVETNSPRPVMQQRMEYWASINSQETVTEPLTSAASLPMEGGIKSDSILPLSSADFPAMTYEDLVQHMAELVNKNRQSEEEYHASFPTDSQFSRVQQQACPAPIEAVEANSPRPATRQRMESWPLTNSQRTIAKPPTPTPSLPVEDKAKPDSIPPLSSADLATTMYEDFDMDDMVCKTQQSISLLHMAVAGNHIETIRVLLQDERVTIDDKDSDGFTALQQAVMLGRSEIVKLLLEFGADPGPVRGGDRTPGAVGGFGMNFTGS